MTIGRPPGGNRIDWTQVELEYCQGYMLYDTDLGIKRHYFPTHAELSSKYSCGLDAVKQRSFHGKWTVKRDLFRAKIKVKLEEKQLSSLFSESASYDLKNLHKINQVHSILDIYLQQYKSLTDPQSGDILIDEETPSINIKEIQMVVNLLKEAHHLTRSILGDPINSNELTEELNNYNSSNNNTSDSKSRKAKIKKLSSKLTAKEKTEQELLEKKKELESRLAQVKTEQKTIAEGNVSNDGTSV